MNKVLIFSKSLALYICFRWVPRRGVLKGIPGSRGTEAVRDQDLGDAPRGVEVHQEEEDPGVGAALEVLVVLEIHL